MAQTFPSCTIKYTRINKKNHKVHKDKPWKYILTISQFQKSILATLIATFAFYNILPFPDL